MIVSDLYSGMSGSSLARDNYLSSMRWSVWFSWVSLGEQWNSTLEQGTAAPSISIPIYHSLIILPFDAAADSIVE
jgi:hypothetical protein